MTSVPPTSIRPQDRWPGFVVASVSYVVTFLVFLALVRHAPGAVYQGSWLGALHLVTALVLIVCNLWLITRAYGFRLHITLAQGVLMGMLSDLLLFHGLALLYHASLEWPGLVYVLLLIASASLMLLAVQGNADSLQRFRREQNAQERDVLTGLYNRLGVTRCYEALPPAARVTVVMIDLNDLKAINDLGGHGAGDQHLQRLGEALSGALPAGACLGRWGGDEFVAVLPASSVVGEMMDRVQRQVPHPDRSLPSFAYGAVTASADIPLNRMLAQADQQMYEAKAAIYQTQTSPQRGRHVGLVDFPQFLMGLHTQQEVLEEGLVRAAELSGFESWFYYQLEDQQVWGQADLRGEIERRHAPDLLQSVGMVTEAVERRSVVWTADYEQSPYAQRWWVEQGLKSAVAMPVIVDDRVVGVAGLFSHHLWQSVTPQARQLLETVAFHLGHLLERGAVTEQLRASVEAGITGMGVILEARDLETAGHTARVVELAGRLGMAAGLDAEQLQTLRLGAYLHDVGKLAIPDRVLLKPGPLDAHEWALMQTHSEMGARMAARLPSLPAGAVELVRSHHERWDGAGYPQGLAAEQIPLLARIFSLCDVYDALVNVRPYKQAWTPAAAQSELRSQTGRQFDPLLTALFLDRVLGEGEDGSQATSPEAAGLPFRTEEPARVPDDRAG